MAAASEYNPPIQVDDRKGSAELAPLLSYLGVPVEVVRLESADFALSTPHGPTGSWSVGVERKTISEMVTLIKSQGKRDNRLVGSQLPKMASRYDLSVLVVEGQCRRNFASGLLESFNPKRKGREWSSWGNLDYRAMDAFLWTLRLKTNVQVIRTWSPQETVMELYLLRHWFSKRWDRHTSHLAFPNAPGSEKRTLSLTKASIFREVVSRLPDVGWERSRQLETLFEGSIYDAVTAPADKWSLIDGITMERAMNIWRILRGIKPVHRRP